MRERADFRAIASWEGGRASPGPSWGPIRGGRDDALTKRLGSVGEHFVDRGGGHLGLRYPDAPPCEPLSSIAAAREERYRRCALAAQVSFDDG